jgi:hypothetical protein
MRTGRFRETDNDFENLVSQIPHDEDERPANGLHWTVFLDRSDPGTNSAVIPWEQIEEAVGVLSAEEETTGPRVQEGDGLEA